jgi:hypothetical protein
MKKLFLLTPLLFLFNDLKASHVAGAELTYQCAGTGIYNLTFTFYRDCFGIDPPWTVSCEVDNSCGFPLNSATLTRDSFPITQIIPNCSLPTTCEGGINTGIQKWIYSGQIILPAECPYWNFAVTMSTRNAAITVGVNPDSYNLYVTASLNNTNGICDTSPVFGIDPVVFACTYQPYCLDPGIFDAEGDSIVCSLIAPLTSPNQTFPFDSGYSFNEPVKSIPPVSINYNNGILCFNAIQPDISVYAILVSEFRNGELIGQVERDIELFTISCSNAPPYLSGINGSGTFDTIVCVNTPTCFDIFSHDPNVSDSTNIALDQSIAGATFTTSQGQNENGQFCWTPGLNDVSSNPYCFTVNTHDNSCPARQQGQRQYCITVYDSIACLTLSVKNSIASFEAIKIYPQPASDYFVIDYGSDVTGKKLTFCIDNILNKRIYQRTVSDRITMVHEIPSGIYLAYILDANGLVVKKGKLIIM